MAQPDPAKLELIYYPDPRLRQKALEVEQFDSWLRDVVERMVELMTTHRGVGLAAPQVGLGIRLFVCTPTGEPNGAMVCVNPVLTDLAGDVEAEEGCLSLPEVNGLVRRARQCRLEAFDLKGNRFSLWGEDLLSRIWQHEVDHLDGTLLIDRFGPAAKIANRRALRELEASYKAATRR